MSGIRSAPLPSEHMPPLTVRGFQVIRRRDVLTLTVTFSDEQRRPTTSGDRTSRSFTTLNTPKRAVVGRVPKQRGGGADRSADGSAGESAGAGSAGGASAGGGSAGGSASGSAGGSTGGSTSSPPRTTPPPRCCTLRRTPHGDRPCRGLCPPDPPPLRGAQSTHDCRGGPERGHSPSMHTTHSTCTHGICMFMACLWLVCGHDLLVTCGPVGGLSCLSALAVSACRSAAATLQPAGGL